MLPAIEMFRGDSYPLIFTIRNRADGQPVPLTGYTVTMTVSDARNPEQGYAPLFTLTGVIDDDPDTGKVAFTPSAVNTNRAAGRYYYDISMTNAQGHLRTVVKSEFKIIQDITK